MAPLKSFNIKLILIGDGGVGKTSIRRQYLGSSFSNTYLSTIGADFSKKIVQTNDYEIIYQIWDIAGQDKYHKVRKIYYVGASALFIVFSIDRIDSLENVKKWILECKSYGIKNVPVMLIGNKTDLVYNISPEISEGAHNIMSKIKEILELDQNLSPVNICWTSAKTGTNIENLFSALTNVIITGLEFSESKMS